MAEALVEHGAVVTVTSSNQDRVAKTISRLQQAYPSAEGRIHGHACDLGTADSADANIQQLLQKTGQLDHIVWTAGDPLAIGKLEDTDLASIQKAGMVRYFSPLLLAKYAPKYLSGGPRSSITFTTGSVSQKPRPGWAVINGYATGLQGLTRGLALDLKPIRVNLVSPGAIDTELWTNIGLSDEQKKGMMEKIEKELPTGKVGTTENLAQTYLGILQDENMSESSSSTFEWSGATPC